MSFNLRNALSNAFVGGGGGGATLAANTFTGAQIVSVNGAASTPGLKVTGTLYTGGTSATTLPLNLVQVTGATSAGWSTGGTGFGVNLAAITTPVTNSASLASTTMVADFQSAGVRQLGITAMTFGGITAAPTLLGGGGNYPVSLSLVGGNGLAYFRRIDDGWLMGMGSGFIAAPSGARIGFSDQSTGANVPTGTGSVDAFHMRGGAAHIKMGALHATTPTNQTFSAHNVTTGTGAALTLAGGTGSVAGGVLNLATSATTGAPTTHIQIKASGVVNFASAAVVTETVVSDRTLAIEVGGTTYKICLKA